MQHDLLPVLIDVDDRITPTKIRVYVLEADRKLRRDYGWVKPCRIYEHQRRSPPYRRSKCQPDREESLLPPVMRFKAIAGERATCCSAIRAHRVISIKARLPRMEFRFHWIHFAFQPSQGKPCAKLRNVLTLSIIWCKLRKITGSGGSGYGVVTRSRCRVVGTRRNDGV